MGYRSEVGLAITEVGYKLLQTEMEKDAVLEERLETILNAADRVIEDNKTKDRLYLWEWYKWYDPALDDLLRGKIEEDHYLFLRIGEDYGDVEVYGRYYNNPFELELKRDLEYVDSGNVTYLVKH